MANGALTEEVAEQLENVAVATRRIDAKMISSFWVGLGVGATIGFIVGYRYSKKRLRSEILEEAEKEISEVRELYRQKMIAVDAQTKDPVEEVVRDMGYATDEDAEKVEVVEERPTRPPVVVEPSKRVEKVLPTPIDPRARVFRHEDNQKDKDDKWNYSIELARRTPETPYIIHQDEYLLNESGYEQGSLIYYAQDDVLVDEDEPQVPFEDKEKLLGPEALRRFGHGADDYNLVHVRNSYLEMEYVVNRVDESWEREVVGLNPDEPD